MPFQLSSHTKRWRLNTKGERPTVTHCHSDIKYWGPVCTLIFAVLLCLTISSCANPFAAPEPTLATLLPSEGQLAEDIVSSLDKNVVEASYAGYLHYTQSRMVEVDARDGETIFFGTWESHVDEELTEAPADGSIAEWRDGYYITHNWSEAGLVMLEMSLGDTLELNDSTYEVVWVFNYPKAAYYEEMRWIVGRDVSVLQTCVPESDYNRIVVVQKVAA